MIVERSSEKVNLHLIKRMVVVYDWLVLSAIIDAILLKTTDAVGPMPPTLATAMNIIKSVKVYRHLKLITTL